MFSLRISREILEWLDIIAARTQRSRASVIRWLIQEAYFNQIAGMIIKRLENYLLKTRRYYD
jgi:predicted DNA-binding protein